jgi:hypothetical protein
MTIAITLLLSSLLIIGILRTVRESRGESPAEQVTESPVQTEKISEPQAEIIIENPPYQAEEKKTSPAKKVPVKKTPAKKVPAKKTTTKK